MIGLVTAIAAAALGGGATLAQDSARPGEHQFRHPRDIGPRYEPGIEQWWEDYKRTGCLPVPHARRLANGRYVVRTTRECGGPRPVAPVR